LEQEKIKNAIVRSERSFKAFILGLRFCFWENSLRNGKPFPQLPRGLGETWEAAGLMRCNLHKKISAGKAVKLYKKPFFSD
jgi:hypothetical protein